MKKILLIILILAMIFTTSCWDMIEINERVFPYTVGVDFNEGEGKKLIISFSYPNINALGSEATSDKKVFKVSTEADNIFEATHELTNRMQQPIYLKHLKVLLVSEEVAKDQVVMKGIIDGLNRDFVINKMVNLLMVREGAEKLIEAKIGSTRQESIGGILYELLKNEQSSTRFTPKSLSGFIGDMDTSSASTIPLARVSGEEILISGGGIFKDYGLVGYIDEKENKNIAILQGKAINDGIDIDFKGNSLSLLIVNLKSRKKLENKEEIKISYFIELEGQIHQYTIVNETSEEKSEELIQEMEKAMEKSLEEDIKSTLNKLQKDIRVDILGISEYLSKYHPKLWRSLEDDWDNIFPNIDIDLDIKMNIRRRGLVK